MKHTIIVFVSLAVVVYGRSIDFDDILEDLTAYDYMTKVGLPFAEEIREAEENGNVRIAGGSAASLGQFPYQAGLIINFSQGQSVCGGSLLSHNRALTAAHCWWDGRNQATSIVVVLGSILLFSGGTRISSSYVVMHEDWTPRLVRNDIAVIYLPSDVGFNDYISPITLPSGTQLYEDFAGNNAVASGYGLTRDGGSITSSQYLSYVHVEIITNEVCRTFYPNNVVSSNICISGAGGRSTCAGDSGGPLTVLRDDKSVVVGVTSFGSARGCQFNMPVAFARVTDFISFIKSNL